MANKKVTVLVCRSCIVQNKQEDPALKNEESLQRLYEKKLKKGFFGKIAELRMVDCLTNCENPNSVQIDREDGEILFGKISDEQAMDEIVQLAEALRDSKKSLEVPPSLQKKLMFVRPHFEWRAGEDAVHADRFPLKDT